MHGGCFSKIWYCLKLHVYGFTILGVFLYLNNTTEAHLTDIPPDETDVRNFSCITFNWEDNIRCTWEYSTDLVTKQVSIKWKLDFGRNGINHGLDDIDYVWNYCPSPRNRSCTWELYEHIDPYRNFTVRINLANHMPYYHQVDIQSLVKPSPVYNLNCHVRNSTSVSLQWNHDLHYYNKTFRIIAKEQSEGASQMTIDVTFIYISHGCHWCTVDRRHISLCECPENTVNITIVGLSKYSTYTFSVSNKPLVKGFWSEEVKAVAKTFKDIPSFPPLMVDGCYSIQPQFPGKRIITVYWTPLPIRDWNGDWLKYRVNISVNNTVIYNETTSNHYTTFTSKTVNDVIHVQVSSENECSLSPESSVMTLYHKDLIKNVVLVEDSNKTFEISWHSDKKINDANFSLFWCPRKFSFTCKTTPKRITVDSSNFKIYLPDFNETNDYLIGLSYNYGTENSGFVWSECLIRPARLSLGLDITVNWLVDLQKVEIKWHFTGCNFPLVTRVVRFYILEYCQDISCRDWKIVKVYDFKMLIPMTKEDICMKVTPVTIHGRSLSSGKRCFPNEKTSHNTKINLIAFYSICGVVAALCLIILILFARRKCQSGDGIDIQVPSLQPSRNDNRGLSLIRNGCISEDTQIPLDGDGYERSTASSISKEESNNSSTAPLVSSPAPLVSSPYVQHSQLDGFL